jgi:hypothetical protein
MGRVPHRAGNQDRGVAVKGEYGEAVRREYFECFGETRTDKEEKFF